MVTFDALPGANFRGTVEHIQPASDFKRGDVTFTATIALDVTGESAAVAGLRWGMSAVVREHRPRMTRIWWWCPERAEGIYADLFGGGLEIRP